ncbi:MAG: hypothetical protein ACI9IP_000769 [Arcticibacterium sp.]|jgi:hypothetical protein
MKKLFLGFAVLFSFSVTAQNLNTPAPSPTQTITQDFALSSIEVKYSRPSVKGREIFGGLVPYGDMWRTGANAPTTVAFGQDVKVGGEMIKAGTYTLLTIPGKTEWEIIFAEAGTSAPNYKVANDVARFKVPAISMPLDIENFTIMLGDQTPSSVNIGLMWADTYVGFPVVADIDSQIMSQIDNVMNKDNKPYYAAAAYYFEAGKDIDKALVWAKKAVEAQPKAYWVRHLLAKVNAQVGNKADATEAAKASMELAKTAGNMDYVRLNEALLKSL